MTTNTFKKSQTTILGLIIVLAGVLVLLNNFDLLPRQVVRVIFSWPSILVFIGIFSLNSENRLWGILLISVGLFFHVSKYFQLDKNFWDIFWPGLIIFIGITLIYGSKKAKSRNSENHLSAHSISNEVDEVVILGSNERSFAGTNFSGGSATALFGSAQFNFSAAQMQNEAAVLELNLIFSGAKIIVPMDWHVSFEAVNIFGGFSDKRPQDRVQHQKTLIIKGSAIFSGVEVRAY